MEVRAPRLLTSNLCSFHSPMYRICLCLSAHGPGLPENRQLSRPARLPTIQLRLEALLPPLSRLHSFLPSNTPATCGWPDHRPRWNHRGPPSHDLRDPLLLSPLLSGRSPISSPHHHPWYRKSDSSKYVRYLRFGPQMAPRFIFFWGGGG